MAAETGPTDFGLGETKSIGSGIMGDDPSIANLLSMIARRYQTQIVDPDIPKNKTRLDVIRKLELITQSIKDLMKHEQESL